MAKKPHVAETDRLLATGDVAKQLGVSEETVRRWIRKGVIPYVVVGPFRLKRITQREVDKQKRDSDGTSAV